MRWMKHVAYVAEVKNEYKNLDGKPLGKYHLGYLGVDGFLSMDLKPVKAYGCAS
jgi:hypothetical protein